MKDPKLYRHETSVAPPEDGGGFVVAFPDLPGCHGVGATPEEALADGQQALFACLDALRAVGREAPVPTPAQD